MRFIQGSCSGTVNSLRESGKLEFFELQVGAVFVCLKLVDFPSGVGLVFVHIEDHLAF